MRVKLAEVAEADATSFVDAEAGVESGAIESKARVLCTKEQPDGSDVAAAPPGVATSPGDDCLEGGPTEHEGTSFLRPAINARIASLKSYGGLDLEDDCVAATARPGMMRAKLGPCSSSDSDCCAVTVGTAWDGSRSKTAVDATVPWPRPLIGADPALREQLVEAAQRVMLRAALTAGSALHRNTSDFGAAMRLSSANSVLFSRHPLAAAGMKRSFAYRQLFWTFVYTLFCVWAILTLGDGRVAASLLRLRPNRLLDPSLFFNASSVRVFGPLVNGCPATASPAAAGPDGLLTLNLSGVQVPNGYYFVLSDGPAEADPGAWAVEASNDNGSSWVPIGVCTWATVNLVTPLSGGKPLPAGGAAARFADCDDGSLDLAPEITLAAPAARGTEVRVSLRPDLASSCEVYAYFMVPFFIFIMFLLCISGHGTLMREAMLSFLGSSSVLSACFTAVALRNGLGASRATESGLRVLPWLFAFTGVLLYERVFILVWLLFGILWELDALAIVIFVNSAHFEDARYQINIFSIGGVALISLGAVCYVLRWRALQQARCLVSGDAGLYEAIWTSIRQEEETYCSALRSRVDELKDQPGWLPAGVAPRQLGRRLRGLNHSINVDPIRSGLKWMHASGFSFRRGKVSPQVLESAITRNNTSDSGVTSATKAAQAEGLAAIMSGQDCVCDAAEDSFNKEEDCSPRLKASQQSDVPDDVVEDGPYALDHPIDSLDQLFVQANILEPILLEKVRIWAAASRGCFQCTTSAGPPRFEVYTGQAGEEEGSKGLQFCALKSVPRAVEKIVRSYDMDVSLLVDVCRQSIVFVTVQDLLSCLNAIAVDPDVVLLRVKNRLDPDYDAAMSAGYRDVNIVLRLRTALTAWLGVDGHVCEVQLVPQAVAELKSAAGHCNYVKFRNLRVE